MSLLSVVQPFDDPGDGVYFKLSREHYDALDRVNWSSLKPLKKSPAHYWAALASRTTDALEFGIAGHAAILEPDVFRNEYTVWRGPDRRTKDGKAAWAAFQSESAGKTVLEAEDFEAVSGMAAAVAANHQLDVHRPWYTEVTVLWTVDGIACKARLDILSAQHSIIDLKTTSDAGPGFGAAVARYDYLGQLAMYQDGMEAVRGERLPVRLLPAEKQPPYVSQLYVVPDELLLLGRGLYRKLLSRLVEVRRLGLRHGYATTELTLSLPSWAFEAFEVHGE